MGPSHLFSPSKETLSPKVEQAPKLELPAKPVQLPNKLFFRLQGTLRWKKHEVVIRLSNEKPFGLKYEGWKFFVPRIHRNTKSIRFMWVYATLGGR